MTDDAPSSLSLMVHQAERMVLADPEKMTAEEAARLVDLISAMKARLKEVSDQCNTTLMEYIKKHGDLEVGMTRYYVGTDTFTTCRSNEAVLKAIVEHTDGDIGACAGFMVSGAWKHGAIKKQLGEEKWSELFVTTPKSDVKTGKPAKKLKKADPRFIKESDDATE